MVRSSRAEAHEHASQSVIAIGNEYPAGHLHPAHKHGRDQLLFAEYGTMLVVTAEGAWVVPPNAAVWIPAGIVHSIRMQSPVGTRSAYFTTNAAQRFAVRCQVIGVSSLLRALLIAAAELPTDYEIDSRSGRIMALIVDEMLNSTDLPLCVPFPNDHALAEICRKFLDAPTVNATVDEWACQLAMSRRTFTRYFRDKTGLSFAEWKRRACLQAALPRLINGATVTTTAMDLGYSSVAAFSTMFTRHFGRSPRTFARDRQQTIECSSCIGPSALQQD